MPSTVQFRMEIPAELAGSRLDQVLAELQPDFSRARLQAWIKAGRVTVNGHTLRAKDKVVGGEVVEVQADLPTQERWEAQSLPLDILYEDKQLIIVNKPPGLLVHPGAGNPDHTLVNALLYHAPELATVPRAGVIHRLDKDTSGVLAVARTVPAHTHLVASLQAREFEREYRALVSGVMTAGGMVDAPVGRHPVHRLRMAVVESGKEAVTHYRVEQRFRAHTLIRLQLETGRTHQIRVHMAHIHYPIVGDPLYGGRLKMPRQPSESLQAALRGFRRQALHAARLGLEHPKTQKFMEWETPLPSDMHALLQEFANDLAAHEDEESFLR